MGSKKKKVQAVLDRISASLDGIEKPVLLEVRSALTQAQREVESDLRMWLSSQHGEQTFTAQRYRNVMANLNASFKKMEDTGDIAERSLKQRAKFIGKLSVSNIRDEWAAFSHIFEGSIQPIELDESILFARGKRILWPQFESSATKYGGRVGERAKREFAVSRARNETIYELTNRIERTLPDVFRGDRWDAERLARTETLNAYNQYHHDGVIEAQKEDPDIRGRWDSSPDRRRCPACASLDGMTVNKAKGEEYVAKWRTSNKKGIIKLHTLRVITAPLHPCCRCVETVWHKSWSAFEMRTDASRAA